MVSKLTETMIRDRAAGQSFTRGQTYYRNGAITSAIKRGLLLQAECEGSQFTPYQVRVGLKENGNIDYATCTCEYDFGGDCKHIVALLLTYLNQPERFEERPSVESVLKDRTQEQLIALIGQMLQRYPDLELLVDRPTPGQSVRRSPVNTGSYRKEMRYALQNYDGWGSDGPESAVYSITENAREFARAGEWNIAADILLEVLDEGLKEDYRMVDDEGDFVAALSEMLPDLVKCLEHLVEDVDYRKSILHALMDAELWDINEGGIGLTDVLDEDVLFAHAKSEDLPELRQKIEAVRDAQSKRPYSDWALEHLEEMLAKIDVLQGADPDAILQRLRDEGMYVLLVKQLLQLNRHEEALEVVKQHIQLSHELHQVIGLLKNAGLGETAAQLAAQAMKKTYDYQLIVWLLDYYRESGNAEAYLRWLVHRLKHEPIPRYFLEVRDTALLSGQWEKLRPQLLADFEKDRRLDMLIEIYMLEHDWENAWKIVDRLSEKDRHYSYMANNLDLEVASKSYSEYPAKALPVYLKHIQKNIEHGNREYYAAAAQQLTIVRLLYRQLNQTEKWTELINDIKEKYKKRPALQDELRKAKV